MSEKPIVCPRCGARDSFIKGYLPDTCVCRVCQSQLDYREIPGCEPDCTSRQAVASARDDSEAWDIGQADPVEDEKWEDR